ncbi:MAG: transcriptional regulator [Magnetococcales bacterium]|nr:transcriptional regulator [Magnetococcales bacterium]
MKTREEKLISGLDGVENFLSSGNKPDDLKVVNVPDTVDVKMIRMSQNLNQAEFANRYGFPLGTVKNWEQGRRKPEGTARILLRIIKHHPEVIFDVLNREENNSKVLSTT